MTDVEKSEISFIMCTIYDILLHFKLFCGKKFFTVFWKIGLLQLTLYCEEKILIKNSGRGEKWLISLQNYRTNYQSVDASCQKQSW